MRNVRCAPITVYEASESLGLDALDLGVLAERQEMQHAAAGLARQERGGPQERVLPILARRLGLDRWAEPLAHPALGLVLDAAADLQLDLDQRRVVLGDARAEQEVRVDLGDVLADLHRRQR